MNENGGPAFPSLEIYERWNGDRDRYEVQSDTATGMSLRDYFAAAVLSAVYQRALETGFRASKDSIASDAYGLADALLQERAK